MMNPVKTTKIKVKWRDVKQAREEEVKEKEKIRVSALEVQKKTVNMIIKLNQALGSPREVQDQCWNELVLSDDGKSPCRCLHESVVFCAQWKQHSGFQVTPGQLPHPQLRLKYLLTEFGLPVTKQLQDVCLKLSPSDK